MIGIGFIPERAYSANPILNKHLQFGMPRGKLADVTSRAFPDAGQS